MSPRTVAASAVEATDGSDLLLAGAAAVVLGCLLWVFADRVEGAFAVIRRRLPMAFQKAGLPRPHARLSAALFIGFGLLFLLAAVARLG